MRYLPNIKVLTCCILQIVIFNFQLLAQGTWTRKADFGGPGRFWAAGFSIGNKGYIGTGDKGSNCWDFWEYDQATDTWKKKADVKFGGQGRSMAVGFSIGNKGYLGTGELAAACRKDFWEWDQVTNVWTQKADFGGTARSRATGFSIGLKGYIGTGYDPAATPSLKKDFWEWDGDVSSPTYNIWTKKADFGGIATQFATSFSIGTKGYLRPSSGNSFWEWNQATNAWTQKANLGGISSSTHFAAVGFAIGTKGYIGTGMNTNNVYRKDFWEWNQATNVWTKMADFGGTARNEAVGFSIGCKGYIGTGYDLNGTLQNDFWEFCPDTACCNNKLSASVSSQNISCYGQCTGTATVAAAGSGSYTYLWNTSPTQSTQVASGLCAGNYTVTITDAMGSTATATIAITQPAAALSLNANGTNNTSCITPNGTATVNANGGTPGYTYSWSASGGQTAQTATGLVAGTYVVNLTDANGCTQTQTVSISGPASPLASASSTSVSCNGGGDGTAAVAAAGGSSPYTYLWNPTAAATATATGLGAGNYVVTVTDLNGCTSTQTVTIAEPAALAASQSAGICSGSAYTLPGGTVVSAGGIYKDTLTSVNGCDSIINTNLTVKPASNASQSASICSGTTYTLPGGTVVNSSGAYKDTLISVNGCDSIITTSLTVNPLPTVIISPNVTIIQSAATTLTASGGSSYQWSTGEATQNINVSPIQTTTYCVTVADGNGCTTKSCATVFVDIPCGALFVPNAFSPNNDGENDEFCLPGGMENCIAELTMTIYDRWGEKIYKSDDKNFCWDGTYQGNLQNTAVFVYYMEAILKNNTEILKQGNISLMR